MNAHKLPPSWRPCARCGWSGPAHDDMAQLGELGERVRAEPPRWLPRWPCPEYVPKNTLAADWLQVDRAGRELGRAFAKAYHLDGIWRWLNRKLSR